MGAMRVTRWVLTGMFCLVLGICLCLCLGWSQIVEAHEMGTSALRLTELSSGSGDMIFKRSKSADGEIAPIDFQLVPACDLKQANTAWEENTEVTQVAHFDCHDELSKHTLHVEGFSRLAPDLIVSVVFHDGQKLTQIASPQSDVLSLQAGSGHSGWHTDYLKIGIEHILTGWDHMLFIVGLFLLWFQRAQPFKNLLYSFSVFTVAHSITLALLVFGWITVPTRAIEALIALSVLWLACELVVVREEGSSGRQPTLIIALFGLLHGSGFALSMVDRGFPQDSLLSTLFLFNVGIEIGQLLVVSALYVVFRLLARWTTEHVVQWGEYSLTLLMGGSALYWTVERIARYV